MQTIDTLSNLAPEALCALLKESSSSVGSTLLEMGKTLHVLNLKRQGKGTLKKYVKAKAGVNVPDQAFCCLVSFSLVSAGGIQESTYDATPLRWLLQVSAILNILEKFTLNEEQKGAYRADVCLILTDAPDNGYNRLIDIKVSLKPGRPKGTGTGKGKAETATPEPMEEPPAPAVDVLSKEHLITVGTAAHECQEPETLKKACAALKLVLEIAEARREELETETLTPV